MTLDELRALATNTRNGFACWPAPYQMSPTLEDAEFLYALVRVTKPDRVIELGTGLGVSARFIGEALAANGVGILWTVEPDPHVFSQAEELIGDLRTVRRASAPGGLSLSGGIELVFIDSGQERRALDIDRWLTDENAPLVLVHDANRRYEGLKQGVGVFLPGSDGLWLGRTRP